MRLPDGIEILNLASDSNIFGMLLNHALGIMVGDFGRFAYHGTILELHAAQLLIHLLQTVQKHAVSEAGHGRLRHPHQIRVACQYGQILHGKVCARLVQAPVTLQHVHDQLQIRLPPHAFAKQYNRLYWREISSQHTRLFKFEC